MSVPIENPPVSNNVNSSEVSLNDNLSPKDIEERVSELSQVSILLTENQSSGSPNAKKKKERCFFSDCKRKLSIVSRFECNGCNEVLGKVVAYCSMHRLASEHDCSFDYKKAHQEKLRKENPLVVANKNPGWDF